MARPVFTPSPIINVTSPNVTHIFISYDGDTKIIKLYNNKGECISLTEENINKIFITNNALVENENT